MMLNSNFRILMSSSGCLSVILDILAIYLILYHNGKMDDYKNYLLYFQTSLLLFDTYFSILMVPIPLFPILGGYSIGFLNQIFQIPTHSQMIFTLWLLGNTNSCIIVSLLKRHQCVALIEQKYQINSLIVRISIFIANLLPIIGTIGFVFAEPTAENKSAILKKYYPSDEWVLSVHGVALYAIDQSLNAVFFTLSYTIMIFSILLFLAYYILYFQMFTMLKSIRNRISRHSYNKHFTATINTVLQNIVFFICFLFPIMFLSAVIYFGFDASIFCYIMVFIFSLYSILNSIVMICTFSTFRRAILSSSFCFFLPMNREDGIQISKIHIKQITMLK